MTNETFARATDEFGRRLGLETLLLNDEGRASLQLSDYSLALEVREDDAGARLIMTLGLALDPAEAPGVYRDALRGVSVLRGLRYPLSASLFRDNLLLSAAIDEREADAALFENVLRFLLEEIERYR